MIRKSQLKASQMGSKLPEVSIMMSASQEAFQEWSKLPDVAKIKTEMGTRIW
jgi:hypothetical protein